MARSTPFRALLGAVLALTAIGFAIRLILADRPLWLDEVWSIENLAPLTHAWQVFWRISHDNNHFFESLWLYWATAFSANPLVLRGPSILMGAATIAAMAKLGARHGVPAALAAAALTTLSYFFVNYSVEARGYAGEALALAIAYHALERGLDEPRSKARFVLAAAAGIGMFWHLAILPALGAFALVALLERRRRDGAWKPAMAATERLFSPAARAVLPALLCVFAGLVATGRFAVGQITPFSLPPTLEAMATLVRYTLGLPEGTPTALALSGCLAAVGLAVRLRLLREERRLAYAVILVAAPLAVLVLRPSNAEFPRYYLVCALFLILLAADLFGAAWRKGGWPRIGATVALCAMLTGDAALLARYQASKAGAWPNALEMIEASGDRVVVSTFDQGVGRLVDYFNRDHAPPIQLAPIAQWRHADPHWLIVATVDVDSEPRTLDLGAGACRMRFVFAEAYKTWGLSAIDWRLYRRTEAPTDPCRTE
jgi:hypothetical protein